VGPTKVGLRGSKEEALEVEIWARGSPSHMPFDCRHTVANSLLIGWSHMRLSKYISIRRNPSVATSDPYESSVGHIYLQIRIL
jgi:hypothetical protein